MIKYLLLDIDGTLINTVPLVTKAVREFVCDFKGIYASISEKAVKDLMHLPSSYILQHFMGDTPLDMDEYYDVYAPAIDALLSKGKLFPKVKETLDELKRDGIKLFILSNKDDGPTKKYLESIFGKDYFDGYQCKIPGVAPLPDPAMVQNIWKKYHLAPMDGLLVGDSEIDLQTAMNVKMKVALMSYGYANKEILDLLPPPDFRANDFQEIGKIVAESKPKQRHIY